MLDTAETELFQALSATARLNIIRQLRQGSCGLDQLGRSLAISPSAMTYHCKVLKAAQLITLEKHGREKFISLNTEAFKQISPDFLESL